MAYLRARGGSMISRVIAKAVSRVPPRPGVARHRSLIRWRVLEVVEVGKVDRHERVHHHPFDPHVVLVAIHSLPSLYLALGIERQEFEKTLRDAAEYPKYHLSIHCDDGDASWLEFVRFLNRDQFVLPEVGRVRTGAGEKTSAGVTAGPPSTTAPFRKGEAGQVTSFAYVLGSRD